MQNLKWFFALHAFVPDHDHDPFPCHRLFQDQEQDQDQEQEGIARTRSLR
jgi:hypothetical protein